MLGHYFSRCQVVVLSSLFVLLFVSVVTWAQASEITGGQPVVSRISYTDVPLNNVIKNLSAQLKLNVVFDESFRNEPKYNLELTDVTLKAALKIIFVQKRLVAKRIEEKTIIVFYDSPPNRTRFEEYPDWPAKSDLKK